MSTDRQRKLGEESRVVRDKFFTKITYFLILFITAVILVFVVMTGTKTENPPAEKSKTYEVSTASGLLAALNEENGMTSTIIIKNDIDFGDANWTPVGTRQKPFSGKIYGNDFTISNLNIILSGDEGENYAGLFGYIKNAEIYKLKLDDVDVSSTKELSHATTFNFGFICGYAEDSSIKLCEVSNTCDLTFNHSKKSLFTIGGIAGKVANTTISNTTSNAVLSVSCTNVEFASENLNYYIGGVVGHFSSSNIINSSSKSAITCSISSASDEQIQTFVGGIIGYNIANNPTSKYIKNCYFAGTISSTSVATSKNQYVAGIVAYGANQTSLQNNIVLNLGSFKINNTTADVTTFFDYSTNEDICTYFADEDAFNIKVEILINSVA